MSLTFDTALITHRGGREYNEDTALAETLDDGRRLWVVCDGMGGHADGEVAAQTAAAAVWAALSDGRTFAEAIDAGHAAVADKNAASGTDMRTTLVAALGTDTAFEYAHCGDSRLYLFRGTEVHLRTVDHSVVMALVHTGDLAEHEVRTHPDRSRVLRALGDPAGFQPAFGEAPLAWRPGDRLLLCTDGIWEHVTDTEMALDAAKSDHSGEWLQLLCERIQYRVDGRHDNYSAVAVTIT